MEPRNEVLKKGPEPGHEEASKGEKKRRFRIVKLGERIAPGGGNGNGGFFSRNHKCAC